MDRKITLPGYELLKKVGEGAMSTVWTARQLSLDRIVAIKILSQQLTRDADAVQRFKLESHAAARIKHPGIVQVYDAGEAEGHLYYVMEFVAGCTVGELMHRKGRLPEKHALLVTQGVALALAHAWDEAHLIHCDIKPENIMFDQDGTIKVADLGLAKILGLTAAGSDREHVEGTPHYMSPEQARGEPNLDCRADIYSLGAMLYHMITGRLPFAEFDEDDVMNRQILDFLPDPMDLNADLSPGVAWMLEKMMVKDRTIRYQSWHEFLSDLEEVSRGGLPSTSLPARGQSTIMRSDARARTPPKPKPEPTERDERKEKEKQTARAKQRIVLPKDLRDQFIADSAKPAQDLARAVLSLVIVVVAVIAVYGTFFGIRYFRSTKRPVDEHYWDRMLPPRSAVKTIGQEAPVPATPPPEEAGAAWRPAPSAEPGAGALINWQNPVFIRGARLFNDALAKYKQYTKDKQNPEILPVVEQQCRQAVKAFEACRASAPPEVNIAELISQCYRLISDCRQSTLVAGAHSRAEREAPAASATTPPPGPPRATAPAPIATNRNGFVLSLNWNTPDTGGTKVIRDLQDLFGSQGVADIDLAPDATLTIFGPVGYLMPVQDALKALNKTLVPRRNVACPGFPKDTLYYYAVDGPFDEGFTKMLLVTDSADHVVAVQLVNESPDESLWLDPTLFVEKWHTYNFIQTRTKASAKWRVAHRVEILGRVVRVDSELVANDEYGYFGLGDSKERVSLYLPQQLVNLILYRVGKPKNGSG